MTFRAAILPLAALAASVGLRHPATSQSFGASASAPAAAPLPSRIAADPSAALTDSLLAGLRFRAIGPAVMGGRIHDVEALPDDPATIYVAAATGGIWKSVNGGVTWTPIFEHQGTSAFGDLAIAPSNHDVLWAGTGEQNNRQSSSWGDGVYRSTDAGRTWTHLGLQGTRAIGRVLVDPRDPDVAWVAALGNLWKPGPDRGVYRTSDGGRSWTKVLYVDTLTGAVDLVMDPTDPSTVYAATYQRLRTPWGFNGGGPGSGIWKTTDAGGTWQRLTDGLPSGDIGRIGLAISPTDPKLLYATVEHASRGGFYRSEDGGASWSRVNPLDPRPMYYSAIFVDPSDDRRVYMLSTDYYRTEDGGKTFTKMPAAPTYDVGVHGDFHTMWIDPGRPTHFFLAGDGGLYETFDRGFTFRRLNNIPIGQFYDIALDDRSPFYIYGGLQDNHSWMGPSATRHWLGIVNDDWREIGFGDGMHAEVDAAGPRYVYSNSQDGSLFRVDVVTGDRLGLRPYAPAGDTSYRFDWTTPSLASRHTPGTIYFGGNRLFISHDRGQTWQRTKDLTRKVDRDTLSIMGVRGSKPMLSKNDGEAGFSEITTIAESPLDGKILWVGTDDGNVQVSRDGGATWTEVSRNVPGIPDGAYVSRVAASGEAPGAAYVAFDDHRRGDFAPWAFRTTDFGATWAPVSAGLPGDAPVRTLAEYPGRPGLLFLGTEHALYASSDRGAHWAHLGGSLPTTLYVDVEVQPRTHDLVVATHGRALFILDDAAPLAAWSAAVAASPAHLFPVRPATIFQYREDLSYRGQAEFMGENPPEGAILTYYLARPAPEITLTVRDSAGTIVRTIHGSGQPGTLRRASWDLRHEPPPSEPDTDRASLEALPRPPHPLAPRGPFVSPGLYKVTLQAGPASDTATVRVLPDPRMPYITLAKYRARERFLMDVLALQKRVWALSVRAKALHSALVARRDSAADGSAERVRLAAAADSAAALQRRIGGGFRSPLRGVYGLAGELNGSEVQQGSLYPPTAAQRQRYADLRETVGRLEDEVRRTEGTR